MRDRLKFKFKNPVINYNIKIIMSLQKVKLIIILNFYLLLPTWILFQF
jgi:hypothetical protein